MMSRLSKCGCERTNLPPAINMSHGLSDHGRLKARLRPMCGLKRLATAAVIAAGHDLIQNIRRGHYELAVDAPPALRLMTAFGELARAI